MNPLLLISRRSEGLNRNIVIFPEAFKPHIQIELSGILGSGRANETVPGTFAAEVLNVNTPDEETLYSVTGTPLKLKGNGIL